MSDSRPSSITRSVRNSFNPEMECLPPDNIDKDISYELCEEVADDQNMEVKRDKNKKINQRNKGSAQGIKNGIENLLQTKLPFWYGFYLELSFHFTLWIKNL